MQCLYILFGGDTSKDQYQEMATKLTSKLKKTMSESTWRGKRLKAIKEEAEKHHEIDEHNINSQLITMIADTILKKQDYYDMLKGNVADKTHMIHSSRIAKLENDPEDPTEIFKSINQSHKQATITGKRPQQPAAYAQKSMAHLDSDLTLMPRTSMKKAVAELAGNRNGEEERTTKQQREFAHREMAKASFIQWCERNLVVALPLLLRIKDKKLILEGYQLNYGLCAAIAMAFEQFSDIATEFILQRNRMTDEDFSVLLKGMTKLTYVHSLTYSENHFGPLSMEALKPVLMRTYLKHSLRALHIKNCKISSKTTHDLLFTLNSRKNFIKSLSLVNVNLSNMNCKELCNLIQRARYLIHLDISWNSLRISDMHTLIEVISENRTLQWLNLSFNQLADKFQEKF